MKHTYRVRIRPQRYYHLIAQGLQPLAADSFASTIEGVIVREIAEGGGSDYFVELQVQRPSHEQALNEILVAIQQLGYSWIEATVTEWADKAVGGAVAGFLGGGAAGASSGDAGASLIVGLIGSLVGAAIGSFIESEKVVYTVHWSSSGWVLTPQVPAPAMTPRVQPGLA